MIDFKIHDYIQSAILWKGKDSIIAQKCALNLQ